MAAILNIEATINQHIAYITPRRLIVTPEYLHLTLVGAYHDLRALSEDSGSTKGALTCGDIAHFKVVLPPSAEQGRIVSFVRQEMLAVESAVVRTDREISLLREYRTRLSADVVTGKLDVREAAAQLQDETEEAEPMDEADALSEGDDAAEDADLDATVEEAGA